MWIYRRYVDNERGSYPVVLMVVLALSAVVVSLSVLLVTEMVSYSKNYQDNLKNVYDVDSTFEFFNNVTKQYLDTRVWGNEEGDFIEGEILNSGTFEGISNFVESNVQGYVNVGNNHPVSIGEVELLNEPRIEQFCRRLSTEDVDGEWEFVRYTCEDNELGETYTFDIQMSVELERKGVVREYEMSLEDVSFTIDHDVDEVRLNMDNVEFRSGLK